MEDFDIQLQLLRKGMPSISINTMVQNQRGSGLEGGCSTYRTVEIQEEAARTLQSYHPEFVSVVQKQTKSAWGGGVRTDVVIQWRKAYESSII
jgi:hypothetical protein